MKVKQSLSVMTILLQTQRYKRFLRVPSRTLMRGLDIELAKFRKSVKYAVISVRSTCGTQPLLFLCNLLSSNDVLIGLADSHAAWREVGGLKESPVFIGVVQRGKC